MTVGAAARIVELLELAEESPTAEELQPYLDDPEPDVRKTALSVMSEAPPSWEEVSPLVAGALNDPDPSVSDMAASLLSELREVLVPSTTFAEMLTKGSTAERPAVRRAAVGSLWRHRLVDLGRLRHHYGDSDAGVRREAVLGMVSLDALDDLRGAATDPEPEIRVAVASGVATIGDPVGIATLTTLATDAEVVVRAAALRAMASTGCSSEAAWIARESLGHPSWEVRAASATALSAASGDIALEGLMEAAADANLDVRKAAVRSLQRWAAVDDGARTALERCVDDPDADVRAFARIGLEDSETSRSDHKQLDRKEI